MNVLNRPKTWARRLVLVTVVALCGLLVAELGARAVSSVFRQRVMTYDDVLGWRPVPDSQLLQDAGYGSYNVEINSMGLRDREHDFGNDQGRFRVLVLGDSVAFGYGGVEQGEVFTEVMQKRVPGVEFINLGVPSFSTDQEYLYLRDHGLKYNPDLVVLCVYQDDFSPTFESFVPAIARPKGTVRLQGERLEFSPPVFPWYYLLVEHSVIAGYLDSQLHLVNWLQSGSAAKSTLTIDEKSSTFRALLAETRELCESHDCELMIMNHPGYAIAPKDDHARRIAGEFARDENVQILDLNDLPLFQKDNAEETYVVGDHIHLNAKAHALIADVLQDFLATATGRNDLFTPDSASASGTQAIGRH